MAAPAGFQIGAVLSEARRILGTCPQSVVLSKISQAVEILANAGDFDPLMGYLDICTAGCIVTLPREVSNILAVNIGGTPSMARSQHYNFHLNGPGDCTGLCNYSWQDLGLVPTYRELISPSKLIAFVQLAEDAGAELWAYGEDVLGNVIRTKENGVWFNGYRIPTVFGYALPDSTAPTFARVLRVRKAETVGSIRLSSFDNGIGTGTLLGNFQWDETDPQYRRIKLHTCADWIRIAFRRAIPLFASTDDWVPMPSLTALFAMLEAMKYYQEGDLARAAGFEATARRWLTEAIWASTPPGQEPVQVNPSDVLFDASDALD